MTSPKVPMLGDPPVVVSRVPCGFCYDGRDTEPITLHTGAVKYLCRVCLGDLAHNGINPDDRSRASAMIQPPAVVAECWTCCGQHTGGIGPNGFDRCSATIPGDDDTCVPLPLSRLDYLGHFAGHDVRPVVKS